MPREPRGGVGERFVEVLQLLLAQLSLCRKARIGNQLLPELLQLLFTLGSDHSNSFGFECLGCSGTFLLMQPEGPSKKGVKAGHKPGSVHPSKEGG